MRRRIAQKHVISLSLEFMSQQHDSYKGQLGDAALLVSEIQALEASDIEDSESDRDSVPNA